MAKWLESTKRRRAEHKKKMEQYWHDLHEATERVFAHCNHEEAPRYEDGSQSDYMLMGGDIG